MKREWLTAIVGVVALLWAGGLAAQSDTPEQKRREELEQMAEQQKSLLDEDVTALSGSEKIEKAEKKINESKGQLEEVSKMLESARDEEQDIMKINCINEKQAAIKGLVKVAEQSYVKLKDAVDGEDAEEANHHYTLIAISNEKVDQLTQESRLCAGEAKRYAEETSVDVEMDRELPDDPDYTSPEPGGVGVLPELTPYQ